MTIVLFYVTHKVCSFANKPYHIYGFREKYELFFNIQRRFLNIPTISRNYEEISLETENQISILSCENDSSNSAS